jgi:septum formation protein
MLLTDLLKGYRLILASQSPRRRALLEGLDLTFDIIVRENIDEIYPSGLHKLEIPEYLARIKSDSYIDLLDEKTLLITADTIVWLKNRVVGKPENVEDAISIVTGLSGNMHEVITGVCIRSIDRIKVFHGISKVWFRKLSAEEIHYYINHYLPLDKAGAYGIQEWIGYAGIEKIEGSFYNVMGLPVQMVYTELINFVTSMTHYENKRSEV